jgi:SPP1 family predicted phage head-tail adaptor
MARCTKIKRNNKTLCAGALKETIILKTRAQQAPKTNTASASIRFDCSRSVKAMVETKSGVDTFDGTNTNSLLTHEFTIRYLSDVDVQNSIEYNCKFFNVERIVNINEENRYLTLICSERGTTDNKVNFS